MANYTIRECNLDRPATPKQLWALYIASRARGCTHDYRGDNLTRLDAANELKRLNAMPMTAKAVTRETLRTARKVKKADALETEFLSYMDEHFGEVISIGRKATAQESVISDDPQFTPANKIKRYSFVGGGCGFSYVKYDKRSKVGKRIDEMQGEYYRTRYRKMFLDNYTAAEKRHYIEIGCPLEAVWAQDLSISSAYRGVVVEFMRLKGVKNVSVVSYYD